MILSTNVFVSRHLAVSWRLIQGRPFLSAEGRWDFFGCCMMLHVKIYLHFNQGIHDNMLNRVTVTITSTIYYFFKIRTLSLLCALAANLRSKINNTSTGCVIKYLAQGASFVWTFELLRFVPIKNK